MQHYGQPPHKHPGTWTKDDIRPRLRELCALDDRQNSTPLHNIVADLEAPGEALAWLAAYDLDPDVSHGAVAALFYVLWNDFEPPSVVDMVREQAAPVLRKAMQNARVPDDRKLALGPLYGVCSGEVSEQEYRSFFKDFQGASDRMITEALDEVTGDPESIDTVLAAMHSMASEDDDPELSRFETTQLLVSRMIDKKPSVAAAVLAANVSYGLADELPMDLLEDAVGLMERANCPEAVWFLDDMGSWPATGALGERMRRTAAKMKLMGIQPACSVRAVFSHGLMTSSDGAGSRQVALFFRTPKGGMDTVAVLLKDSVGIKDLICVYEDGAEAEESLRERFDGLPMAPCSLELARELINDALACHARCQTLLPPYWALCRPYFGPAPFAPEVRVPDLRAYDLEALSLDEGLLEDSEVMADSYSYGCFSITSDRAYDFVAGVMPKRATKLPKAKYAQFLREITPEEQALLLSRMAQALEVEALAGRAVQPLNRMAAGVWWAMKNNIMAFHEVPYIKALAVVSIEMIIHNLRMGFRTQAEADQAALEEQLEEDGYWSEDDEY